MQKKYSLINLVQAFIVISIFLFSANSDLFAQTWTKVEGTEKFVNRILFPKGDKDKIIVASDIYEAGFDKNELTFYLIDSKGYKVSNDRGATFGDNILAPYYVLDIAQAPDNNNILLASVVHKKRGEILVSEDNGKTWDNKDKEFLNSYYITKFAGKKLGNKELMLASACNTKDGFISSEDRFKTQSMIEDISIQSRDLKFSSVDKDLLFIAGDGKYQSGVMSSRDNGQTWSKSKSGLEGLRIHCVAPSAKDAAVVYCGADTITKDGVSMGKGIFISLDTGKTWKLVGAKGAHVYAIEQHPNAREYMVAAAGKMGVFVSANAGRWWDQHNDGLPADKPVRTVAVPNWDTTSVGAIFFAGTEGDGLYQSKPVRSDVNGNLVFSDQLEVKSLYPNPVQSRFELIWNLPKSAYVNISIFDLTGRKVEDLANNVYLEAGKQSLNWEKANSLVSGMYFIVISTDRERIMHKFIKN